MKSKTITYRVRSPEDYLTILNGIYNLTQAEVAVLAEFIKIHLTLKAADIQVNAFSIDMKKRAARRLGKPNFNTLNTYIKALADKGAIRKISGGYEVHPDLMPGGEDVIVFKIK